MPVYFPEKKLPAGTEQVLAKSSAQRIVISAGEIAPREIGYALSDAGASAARSGRPVVSWNDGVLTMGTSNPGESVEKVTIDGQTWIKITPSTLPEVPTVVRWTANTPFWLGDLKSLSWRMMHQDMSPTQIVSGKVAFWMFPTGLVDAQSNRLAVRIGAVMDKQWPGRVYVESFGMDGFINAAQPVTDLAYAEIDRIDIVLTSGTSSAAKAPILIGPMVADRRGKGALAIRLDGCFASQSIILAMLERYGLRATLALTDFYVGTAGRLTEAQIQRAYDYGHDVGGHTAGNKSQGWDSVGDYPDAASIIADRNLDTAYRLARGWTRGIGHWCHGYTNALVNTVPNERQIMVRDALIAAGAKTITVGGRYLAATGGVGHLFPYADPDADWLSITGGVMFTNTDTLQQCYDLVDASIDRGQLAVGVGHRSVRSSPGSLEMTHSQWAALIEYAADRQQAGLLDIVTVSDFDVFKARYARFR